MRVRPEQRPERASAQPASAEGKRRGAQRPAQRREVPEAPRVELRIPSVLGWERVAMDVASSVAQRMGFPAARVEDIRTAVSEATVNAIEHGNAGDPSRVVVVALTPTPTLLEIRVRDGAVAPLRLEEEVGGPEAARPDLEAMLAGEAAARGWGVFLIRSLVDEAEFSTTGLGNLVRMVVHLSAPGGTGGG